MPIDYSKYPPNWKTEIRPRILKRAENCCEFCMARNGREIIRFEILGTHYYLQGNHVFNAENGEYVHKYQSKIEPIIKDVKPVKIVLTIAHLDHDETNWEVKDDRLAALCQRCHLRYDIEEKKKRRSKKKQNEQTN